ncbi:hypothetical protein DITRI_Ditri19aG0195100 [Diplodiscus trichospermus]
MLCPSLFYLGFRSRSRSRSHLPSRQKGRSKSPRRHSVCRSRSKSLSKLNSPIFCARLNSPSTFVIIKCSFPK